MERSKLLGKGVSNCRAFLDLMRRVLWDRTAYHCLDAAGSYHRSRYNVTHVESCHQQLLALPLFRKQFKSTNCNSTDCMAYNYD